MTLEEMIEACRESMASEMAGYRYGDPEFIPGPIVSSRFMVGLCRRIIALEEATNTKTDGTNRQGGAT